MEKKSKKLGIYSSYDDSEKANGDIGPAVDISNRDYLIWLEKSIIISQKFQLPTVFVARIKKKGQYYKGELRSIKRRKEVNVEEILSDNKHRPHSWIERDQKEYRNFQSVLFIHGLKQIPQPSEVFDIKPPIRPVYIEFEDC